MPGGAGSLGAGHPAYAPVSGAARGVVRGRAHVAREVRGGATLGEQLAAPDAPLETSLRHGETDLGQRAPTAHGSRLLGVGLGGRPEELRVVGGAPRHGTVQLERVLGRGTEDPRVEGVRRSRRRSNPDLSEGLGAMGIAAPGHLAGSFPALSVRVLVDLVTRGALSREWPSV